MSCAACSARVEKAVSALQGVESVSVNLLTNSMQVEGSVSEKEVIDAVVKMCIRDRYHGQPKDIPVVDQDFIFSAIGEEFGAIFAILLILLCLTCFIAFLNTAMQQISMFNKLGCVGLGIQYAVQIIVTVGGAIKMIPSTGVTFPLLSYGGSSILSTLIVFAIIQGLAIVGTTKHPVKRKVPQKGAKHVKERNTQEIRKIEDTQEIKIR